MQAMRRALVSLIIIVSICSGVPARGVESIGRDSDEYQHCAWCALIDVLHAFAVGTSIFLLFHHHCCNGCTSQVTTDSWD